ncbi:hypothetical protein VNO80_15534 [Phaseolus coccineus]|uniref:Uncharacterized protein n=1 Tax=Phaseolus coccineus TaxID=3886 RepID=A0AAN9MKE8_PHACN
MENIWRKDCKEFKPERWLKDGHFMKYTNSSVGSNIANRVTMRDKLVKAWIGIAVSDRVGSNGGYASCNLHVGLELLIRSGEERNEANQFKMDVIYVALSKVVFCKPVGSQHKQLLGFLLESKVGSFCSDQLKNEMQWHSWFVHVAVVNLVIVFWL